MDPIEKQKKALVAATAKLNEVIEAVNPLLDIQVKFVPDITSPKVEYSEKNLLISIPKSIGGAEELELYICENGVPVQKTFFVSSSDEETE
ncbi:hypothetical protein [Puniceicoccus vermicola]|uniref:Uncharacterized protein n=1 Tax=Puniceicoccus vermicola TaxID=388746 RepID=A0A7X1E4I3_9BACT|nr:hypothetical protein [Puniceicoccus vermicola]MBC2602089.1 hypothetical protein [Puniceicoccus vermicola]